MSWSDELAKKAGCSRTIVYRIAKMLGRRPTVEELVNRKHKIGRPLKYVEINGETSEKGE